MDDKTKRAKPLPCPFCGKKRVTVERYCVGSHKEYWVECLSRKCGEATGPLGDTADEAVAKWNAAPRPQEAADA